MSFVPKPYTGTLFPNDRKEKDTHPDWKGSIILEDGHKLWVSGWNKTAQSGTKFISFALNEADERPVTPPAPEPDNSEEIAF